MFRIKKEILNDMDFNNALQTLANTHFPPGMPIKASYNVARILRKTKNAQKAMAKPYDEMLKKFVKLDEKGNILSRIEGRMVDKDGKVTNEGTKVPNTFQLKNKEDKEKLEQATDAFFGQEISIESNKININDLQGVDVTPGQLEALHPIIEDGPQGPGISIVQPGGMPTPPMIS